MDRVLATLFGRGSDRRGIAAVEFALGVPIVITLIIGMVEFSFLLTTQTLLRAAIRDAAAVAVLSGAAPSDRELRVQAELERHRSVFINPDLIDLQPAAYLYLQDIGGAEPFEDKNGNQTKDNGEKFTDSNGNGVWDGNNGTPDFGRAGEYVVYTVSYDWTPIVSLFRSILPNGVYRIEIDRMVRNEP